jgi:hypothetical protein
MIACAMTWKSSWVAYGGQGWRYPTAADSRVAFHEAGHAVIARKLGLSCGMVTLEPAMNGPKAEIAWRYYPKRPNATQEQANAAFAIAMYAGREAERMICGEPEEGTDRHDRELAHDAVGDDPGLESELRAWAAAMVQEHRETIEWFARALLQSGTLIPLEADSLVAQLSPPGEHWLHDV